MGEREGWEERKLMDNHIPFHNSSDKYTVSIYFNKLERDRPLGRELDRHRERQAESEREREREREREVGGGGGGG